MLIDERYPLSELTGKIIGCALEVHRNLGNGFQEIIYQRALALEMTQQGLEFSRELEVGLLLNFGSKSLQSKRVMKRPRKS